LAFKSHETYWKLPTDVKYIGEFKEIHLKLFYDW